MTALNITDSDNKALEAMTDSEFASLWRAEKDSLLAAIAELRALPRRTRSQKKQLKRMRKRAEMLSAGCSRHMAAIGKAGGEKMARRRKQRARRQQREADKLAHAAEVAARHERRAAEAARRAERDAARKDEAARRAEREEKQAMNIVLVHRKGRTYKVHAA